jgi:hypothetical protein
MNERIRDLIDQIAALDDELRDALSAQEQRVAFTIKGKRVEFEQSVQEAHRRLKTNVFRWLVTNRPLNLITGPVIYGMALPLLLMDLCVSFYQLSCFPIYGIPRVHRDDYFVYDRQQLGYLNFIERFHCTYCAYANGLLAYATEIVARTEEYFCPIKHARKMRGAHARYARFLEYGDAGDYAARLEEYRRELERKD